jgi:hypothetical protein
MTPPGESARGHWTMRREFMGEAASWVVAAEN